MNDRTPPPHAEQPLSPQAMAEGNAAFWERTVNECAQQEHLKANEVSAARTRAAELRLGLEAARAKAAELERLLEAADADCEAVSMELAGLGRTKQQASKYAQTCWAMAQVAREADDTIPPATREPGYDIRPDELSAPAYTGAGATS